jgi:hypothetical protein
MDLTDTAITSLVAMQGQGVLADVQTTMLKKALDQEASTAAALIAAVPAPPSLASQGSIGTRVNTFA